MAFFIQHFFHDTQLSVFYQNWISSLYLSFLELKPVHI